MAGLSTDQKIKNVARALKEIYEILPAFIEGLKTYPSGLRLITGGINVTLRSLLPEIIERQGNTNDYLAFQNDPVGVVRQTKRRRPANEYLMRNVRDATIELQNFKKMPRGGGQSKYEEWTEKANKSKNPAQKQNIQQFLVIVNNMEDMLTYLARKADLPV